MVGKEEKRYQTWKQRKHEFTKLCIMKYLQTVHRYWPKTPHAQVVSNCRYFWKYRRYRYFVPVSPITTLYWPPSWLIHAVFGPFTCSYFSPCSVSFVLIGEYIKYSPLINFRLIIPSNIHLQCLCSKKNEKKQHHEGNMALRIISILIH